MPSKGLTVSDHVLVTLRSPFFERGYRRIKLTGQYAPKHDFRPSESCNFGK